MSTSVAIIGSGNIGTDLMIKIIRGSGRLRVGAMVGIDPSSDGLARARRMGVPTTAEGVDGLLAMPEFADVELVFDATSASAHRATWAKLDPTGVRVMILNPADPPILMRNTVYCLVEGEVDRDAITASIVDTAARVAAYVPGYRLKQDVQFSRSGDDTLVTTLLEVTGAAHYLPVYAGNLDIMTSAALATAERLLLTQEVPA